MGTIILPFKDKIYRYALRLVGDEMDAEDILQELYIRIWKRKDVYESLENKEAWCMTVTRNLAIDSIRNSKKRQYTELSGATGISDKERNPFEQLAHDDTQAMLGEWLSKLPENQREALHLREIEGMTYKEIAEITKMSLEQVKSNIFRGRLALKALLEKNIEESKKMLKKESSMFN